jgi:hypothetical protein
MPNSSKRHFLSDGLDRWEPRRRDSELCSHRRGCLQSTEALGAQKSWLPLNASRAASRRVGAARSTIQTLAGARWFRSWASDFRRAVCVPTRVKSRRVEESLRQSLGLHGCRPNGPAPARCSHWPATPHADVPPVDGCFVPSASSPRPLPRRSRSQQQQLQQSGWSSGRTP